MMDITKWAEDLTEEVYNEWKTKYSFWEDGFKVFYSPVRYRPELMIISLNPGGTKRNFVEEHYSDYEDGDFSLPDENEYITSDYKFAKEIKILFKEHENFLKTSVVLTTLFFRSSSFGYWEKNNPKKTRLVMERFAYDKVKQILDKDFTRDDFLKKFPNARTFPQIIINKKHVGGYAELKRWLEQNSIDEDF